MNKNIFFLITFLALTFVSCNDNCSDVDAPESPSLFIEVVDEVSEENVFANNTYTEDQVTVVDPDDNLVPFNVVIDSQILHIVLENEIQNNQVFYIRLNNPDVPMQDEVEVIFSTEKFSEECYTQYKVVSVNFPNNDTLEVNGIIKVKI